MDLRAVVGFWTEHRRLIIVLCLALGLRVAWWAHAHPEPVSDYQVYQALAENLLDRGHFGLDQPTSLHLPGFPSLVALLMVISRSIGFLSLAMVVLSSLACLLVYSLARRLTGDEELSLVAAAACAINPTFVLYSPVLATEHLFVPLVLIALLLATRIPEELSMRTSVFTGVVLGIAALTRGEAMFYVPVVAMTIWIIGSRHPVRVRIRHIGLVLAALLVVTTPWLIRNAVTVDSGLTLSTAGGMNFYFGHNPNHYGWSENVPWPPGDDVEANRIGWRLGLEHIVDRPLSMLESIRDGTYGMLGGPSYALFWSTQDQDPDVFLKPVPRHVPLEGLLSNLLVAGAAITLTLGLASFLAWRRWSQRLKVVATSTLVASWAGYAVLFFGHPRFRYTAEMVLMILVAVTIVTLRRSARSWDSPGS